MASILMQYLDGVRQQLHPRIPLHVWLRYVDATAERQHLVVGLLQEETRRGNPLPWHQVWRGLLDPDDRTGNPLNWWYALSGGQPTSTFALPPLETKGLYLMTRLFLEMAPQWDASFRARDSQDERIMDVLGDVLYMAMDALLWWELDPARARENCACEKKVEGEEEEQDHEGEEGMQASEGEEEIATVPPEALPSAEDLELDEYLAMVTLLPNDSWRLRYGIALLLRLACSAEGWGCELFYDMLMFNRPSSCLFGLEQWEDAILARIKVGEQQARRRVALLASCHCDMDFAPLQLAQVHIPGCGPTGPPPATPTASDATDASTASTAASVAPTTPECSAILPPQLKPFMPQHPEPAAATAAPGDARIINLVDEVEAVEEAGELDAKKDQTVEVEDHDTSEKDEASVAPCLPCQGEALRGSRGQASLAVSAATPTPSDGVIDDLMDVETMALVLGATDEFGEHAAVSNPQALVAAEKVEGLEQEPLDEPRKRQRVA